MKVLNILLLGFVVLSIGCKTQKIAPMPEPVSTATTAKTPATSSASVSSKEESVTAAKGEASDFGSKRFYVILGSFSIYDNALKFKKKLMGQDFTPGILVVNKKSADEKDLYRVSVNSYDDEAQARARISDIRQKYPDYSDVWLLIKKQ
jgi:septal ring-binding cell division protein DamX